MKAVSDLDGVVDYDNPTAYVHAEGDEIVIEGRYRINPTLTRGEIREQLEAQNAVIREHRLGDVWSLVGDEANFPFHYDEDGFLWFAPKLPDLTQLGWVKLNG